MKTTPCAAILVLALAGTASAERADDDLQAVRRAVASSQAAAAPAEAPPPAAPRTTGAEMRWFKVRLVEKTGKKARVSLNLPLVLARPLLRALDSGQSLVEIDDEEATVRVWVE